MFCYYIKEVCTKKSLIINKPSIIQEVIKDKDGNKITKFTIEFNHNLYQDKYEIYSTYYDNNILICSAVYFEEGNYIVLGTRHSNCLQIRNKLFEGIYDKRICENEINTFGGFYTLSGEFVNRKKALKLMNNNSQYWKDMEIRYEMLFSENII